MIDPIQRRDSPQQNPIGGRVGGGPVGGRFSANDANLVAAQRGSPPSSPAKQRATPLVDMIQSVRFSTMA